MFRACFGKPRLPKEDSDHETSPTRLPCKSRLSRKDAELCQSPKRSVTGCQDPAGAAPSSSEDGQRAAGPTSRASAVSSRPADGATGQRTRLNASKLQQLNAENVVICDAIKVVEGLRLHQHELGRGTYGLVVTGAYRGVSCAVKVMLSNGLDRAALRELLLAPSLVHPHIVPTFTSRAAHLTHEFFDLLEGGNFNEERDRSRPRTLEPIAIQSGDGFGEPCGLNDGLDPLLVLHQILHALGAETGKMVVIVVQEYCDRSTLNNAIRKNIFNTTPMWGLRLARRTLLRTAGEVARGLLHLHDVGVVHGDLKPANILLHSSKEDRRGFTAKLADFGLSHVLPDAVSSLVTKSWGSIAYMAPEAFSGKVSRATDVWAFGVCLWEMLTGRRPYQGMNQDQVITGLQNNTLALIWPEAAPMAAPINELGRRCLSHDPADRPSFDGIIEELVRIERAIRAELLGGQVVEPASPPPPAAAAGPGAAAPAAPAAGATSASLVEDDLITDIMEL